MKRDDPKRLKLQGDRDRAHTWLDILCKGIGESLINAYGDPEELRLIVERVNNELGEAIDACDRANKAYWPYIARRRARRAPRKKKAA